MMESRVWNFGALDTWFFRDSSPFRDGDKVGNTQVIFPPPMATLQGAIRTALASAKGWIPGNDAGWPEELGTPEDLGELNLFGPYLQWQGQPLFPMPRMVLMSLGGETARLEPGEAVRTDIGMVRLPTLPPGASTGLKEPEDYWITRDTFEAVLAGDVPVKYCYSSKLWNTEFRVGLTMQERAAEPGKLYQTYHTRPSPTTSIAVEVLGISPQWQETIPSVLPLGGEGRFAQVDVYPGGDLLPTMPDFAPDRSGRIRFVVVLVTPGYFANVASAMQAGPLPFPCVSAVVGRTVAVGGWDLKNGRPRSPLTFIPAGSVWFYEIAQEQWGQIASLHGQKIGNKTEYGYGQILLGKW